MARELFHKTCQPALCDITVGSCQDLDLGSRHVFFPQVNSVLATGLLLCLSLLLKTWSDCKGALIRTVKTIGLLPGAGGGRCAAGAAQHCAGALISPKNRWQRLKVLHLTGQELHPPADLDLKWKIPNPPP